MTLFNDREIATAIWLSVFLAFALSKKPIREALLNAVKAFFHWKILTSVVFMILYAVGIVWLLYVANLWTAALLKDTIVWFFSGMVLAFSFLTSHDDEKVFSRIVSGSVKIVVILEFLVSTYTFSLPVELLLIPFATVIAMMDVVAKADPKYSSVARLTTGLQVLIGVAVLAVAVVKAVADFSSLQTIDTIRQVLLAPVLSVLFVPLIYLLLLYAKYESLFIRLGMGSEMDRAVKRYAKWRLISHLGISVQKVGAFARAHALDLMRIRSKEDIDRLLGARAPDLRP